MKVLHINQSDIHGGAGIAGYRLHQSLLQQGIDSQLLVGKRQTNDPQVHELRRHYRVENQLSKLTGKLGLNHVNHISSFDIPKYSFFKATDVLNFHNLHTPYFSYLSIPKLTASKPAVFTLHDMWSFTGHCAYSYDCNRWQNGCGSCPYPEIYPSIQRDATTWEWRLKDWVYSRSNLTIVTPSRWLTEQARQSMLNRFPIHHIPYGIDTEAYRPLNPEYCREILGILPEEKVLLFSAVSLNDSRKGGDLLLKVLQSLPLDLKQKCVLLTLGNSTIQLDSQIGIRAVNLGYVESDHLKSLAYSAADLFLFPTRADNLPLVLQESMSCGTPMVSFNIGGVPDLVRPGITGFLAKPEDTENFKNYTVQLLENSTLLKQMKANCRQIAVAEYSLESQAYTYINLYKEILNQKSNLNLKRINEV